MSQILLTSLLIQVVVKNTLGSITDTGANLSGTGLSSGHTQAKTATVNQPLQQP